MLDVRIEGNIEMAKSAVSPLSAGLVVKKGQATPAAHEITEEKKDPVAASGAASATEYYKSLTVKLDKQRFDALKRAGIDQDKKSQQIFTEALDAWLLRHVNN